LLKRKSYDNRNNHIQQHFLSTLYQGSHDGLVWTFCFPHNTGNAKYVAKSCDNHNNHIQQEAVIVFRKKLKRHIVSTLYRGSHDGLVWTFCFPLNTGLPLQKTTFAGIYTRIKRKIVQFCIFTSCFLRFRYFRGFRVL
jgi:hypothetical protein